MNLDFSNKKVLIQGLGLNKGGVGMVKFFTRLGANIIVTDLRTESQLAPSIKAIKPELATGRVKLVLGKHRDKDFIWADIVIRNPAVKPGNKYIELAKKHEANVYMEMSLFLKLAPGIKVGITGTRGKSTSTALVYEFLRNDKDLAYKHDFLLAGNIGKSAINELEKITDKTITVLEISSFQASVMRENKQSVNIGLVTNIYPDHLNWHPNMEDYIQSKRALIEFQTKEDFAILSLDDEVVSGFADYTKGTVFGYSLNKDRAVQAIKTGKFAQVFYFSNKKLTLIAKIKKHEKTGKIIEEVVFKLPQDTKLKGKHNKQNILAAFTLSQVPILNVSTQTIAKVLKTFTGLVGRQQFVKSIGNVDFYNDTTATMDVAVKMAIDRFSEEYGSNTIFIMGGVDKGIDYKGLLKKAKEKNVKAIVLLEGTASEKIKEWADKYGVKTYGFYGSMKDAVDKAYKLAQGLAKNALKDKKTAENKGNRDKKDDNKIRVNKINKQEQERVAVILSPAGSSFNMFLNEWDRSDKFIEAVDSLEK